VPLFDSIYLLPQHAFCLVICAIHLKVFSCICGHMNERRADDFYIISSLLIESCFVFSDVGNLQLPTIGIGKQRSAICLKWLICDSHLSDRHNSFSSATLCLRHYLYSSPQSPTRSNRFRDRLVTESIFSLSSPSSLS
jgi:hypothetical protein